MVLAVLLVTGVPPAGAEGAAFRQPWPPFANEPAPAASGTPELNLAMDARGNAVAVWIEVDSGSNTLTLQTASRPSRGQWSQAETLTQPFPAEDAFGEPGIGPVDLAVSRRGDVVVAWAQTAEGGGRMIEAATRRRGGEWSTRAIALMPRFQQGRFALAGGPRGHALIAWTLAECPQGGCGPATSRTRAVELRRDGSWSAPQLIFETAFQPEPRFAVDRRGGALAVWTEGPDVRYATRRRGGAWSAPDRIAVIGTWDRTRVLLAMNARGDAVALWTGLNTNDNDVGTAMIAASVRPRGGAWSPAEILGTTIFTTFEEVAIDARGNALAIAQYQTSPGGTDLSAITRPRNGRWSAPEALLNLRGMGSMEPALAVNPRGEAVLGVTTRMQRLTPDDQCCTIDFTVQAMRRDAAGRWAAPQLLRARDDWFAGRPLVAISDRAEAVLLWGETKADGTESELHAAAAPGRCALSLSPAGRGTCR